MTDLAEDPAEDEDNALTPEEARTVLWQDALTAAALFAVSPHRLGGIVLRGHAGPVREFWLEQARTLLPEQDPFRKVPGSITEDRLLGGLDLSATLTSGSRRAAAGLLAEVDGGVILIPMAERLLARTAAHLMAALDQGRLTVEREGLSADVASRFGLIALDEGLTEDERIAEGLADRSAFLIDLEPFQRGDLMDSLIPASNVLAAREKMPHVTLSDEMLERVGHTAVALQIESLRAPILALEAARASAALNDRTAVAEEDVILAARLVLLPRGQAMPEPPPPEDLPEAETQDQEDPKPDQQSDDIPLDDQVLDAAETLLPDGLLRDLLLGQARRDKAKSSSGAGQVRENPRRGRPAGTRPGDPRQGYRLSLIDTLRTAAPWQPIRKRTHGHRPVAVHVQPDDFRVIRFKEKAQSVILFVVDASGSAAFQRLAEAKGAVELLLADCYVRRDRVALMAFRGEVAELILPPTRSLTRAKRVLGDLPGGGGTPLATAIDQAAQLAHDIRRRGETPILCFLTDGRANIARDGSPGRPQARDDALQSAKALSLRGITTLFIDTAPRPQDAARALAAAMDARYMPLPVADAGAVNKVVRASLS